VAFLFGGFVDQLGKLKRMLNYWEEHNNKHVKIYKEWPAKISSLGNAELSRTLVRLYKEQKRLNKRLEEAKVSLTEDPGLGLSMFIWDLKSFLEDITEI
jgi:hypothetical protein